MDDFGDRRPLNPKVCILLSIIFNAGSFLERLSTKAGLPGLLSNRKKTLVGIQDIFVHVEDIVVPCSITQVHVIPLKVVFKRVRRLRIYD